MNKRDKLDQLLFDAAKTRTGEMHFDLAWEAVQAAHRKKQKRRASIQRYTSMAAMLALGLFLGLMADRMGLIDGQITATQSPLPAATPALESPSAPESTPDSIVIDPPMEEHQGGKPPTDPGDVIVAPPLTDEPEITVPYNTDDIIDPPKNDDIIDPPKTDNGDIGIPHEIEIDPPKTDAFDAVWFGNVQRFPNFPTQMPEGFDMSGFMPGWLPAGFDAPKVFGSGWSSQCEGGGEWGYIFVSFQVARDLPGDMVRGLKIGEGRPRLKSYGEDEPAENVDWVIRIDEENYFYIEFINVSFEDTVRVINNIK